MTKSEFIDACCIGQLECALRRFLMRAGLEFPHFWGGVESEYLWELHQNRVDPWPMGHHYYTGPYRIEGVTCTKDFYKLLRDTAEVLELPVTEVADRVFRNNPPYPITRLIKANT